MLQKLRHWKVMNANYYGMLLLRKDKHVVRSYGCPYTNIVKALIHMSHIHDNFCLTSGIKSFLSCYNNEQDSIHSGAQLIVTLNTLKSDEVLEAEAVTLNLPHLCVYDHLM